MGGQYAVFPHDASDLFEEDMVPLCDEGKDCSTKTERRDSTMEKIILDSAQGYAAEVKTRCLCCLITFVGMILYYASGALYDLFWAASFGVTPGGNYTAVLPSLNLLDYETDVSFPVFLEDHPNGLRRSEMPQLDLHDSRNLSMPWFTEALNDAGGSIGEQMVDLRFTEPLQSEVSGLIVYNVIMKNISQQLDKNANLFGDRIVLLETPVDLIGRLGNRIPAGTLLNLDGHHTNHALKICAKIQHTSLRRGFLSKDHICGKNFATQHSVKVIRGIHPLQAISLALDTGATSGQGLNPAAQD
mmetsp:Transcript_20879/g.38834  ORF Transcript_20879/g.38834 Transcript_20879/m.38834 type:complete len:301 (+) Transcript_20879:257-1159(+)